MRCKGLGCLAPIGGRSTHGRSRNAYRCHGRTDNSSPEISGIIRYGPRSARGNAPFAGSRLRQFGSSITQRWWTDLSPQRPEARCSRAMRLLVPARSPSAFMRRHGTPRNGDLVHAETDAILANGEEHDETALNRIAGTDRKGGTAYRALEVLGRTSSRLRRYRAVSPATDNSAKTTTYRYPLSQVVYRGVVRSLPRCGADTGASSCLSN